MSSEEVEQISKIYGKNCDYFLILQIYIVLAFVWSYNINSCKEMILC